MAERERGPLERWGLTSGEHYGASHQDAVDGAPDLVCEDRQSLALAVPALESSEDPLTVGVGDAEVHGGGMEIDPAVESMLSGVESQGSSSCAGECAL